MPHGDSRNLPLSAGTFLPVFHRPPYRYRAGTCCRCGTTGYRLWISSPDLKISKTPPGNSFLLSPDFFLSPSLPHTIFPAHRRHRDFPCYGSVKKTCRLFPHPAPRLSHTDTTYQENIMQTYAPALPPVKTTSQPLTDLPLFPDHTDTSSRYGIPDRYLLFPLPQKAWQPALFHTTPVPFPYPAPQRFPVHRFFPCHAWHRRFHSPLPPS